MKVPTALARLALVGLLVAPIGCDKIKSIAGSGESSSSAEGGATPTTTTATPSVLGGLFAPDFQGEITMTMTSRSGKPATMVVGIKKPKYRMDMTGGTEATAGSFILDLPTKKGWMLLHQPKLAMELDLDKAKTMRKNIPGMPPAPNPAPSAPPKIEKTGKKDVVAGYTCDVWNITSDNKRSEVCLADGLSWIDLSDLGMAGPAVAVAAVSNEANRFPLRVIAFDQQGVEDSRMEAQKIDKKPLPDASFIPPADYQRMPMGGLPGMGAMPGIPAMPAIPTPPPRR